MIPPLVPWVWRSYPLQGRSGSAIFAALFQHHTIATLLESPALEQVGHNAHSRYSICAGPPRHRGQTLCLWTPPLGHVLPWLHHRFYPAAPISDAPDLPFVGGCLGWLGYDLAWEIEQLPWRKADGLPFPVAYWYEPEAFAVLDHHQQVLWLAASSAHDFAGLEKRLEQASLSDEGCPVLAAETALCMTQPVYEKMVRQAQAHIQAGDIFQANLSLRFVAQGHVNAWALYRRLQAINPSPFASYWQTPWGAVVSCSPERLVQVVGEQVQTRPIAGTRSRGSTPEADRQQAQDLCSNAKERAEHTMLVDLERNDLGRVCQWGTVQVDELFVIERYSHVMHLVSNVQGRLRSHCSPADLVRAVFPGGTITGCPKVRCMEIIEALEPLRRSLFYGSCGYLDYRGHLDLNILIRTLLVVPPVPPVSQARSQAIAQPHTAPAQVWGQVGAGIVADSQPTQEWLESLHKAQAQLAALQGEGVNGL